MEPIYIPKFADAEMVQLLKEIPWGTFTDARQECFMAEEMMTYTYGEGRGVRTYASVPYHGLIASIRETLNARFKNEYNVCFLNRYDDAGQHLGWHADDSPGMDHKHPIAVISFGQARDIWWRTNEQTGIIPLGQRQLLEHGSLFVMPAGFQRTYQHRIPKGGRAMTPRVSLTFRHYIEETSP